MRHAEAFKWILSRTPPRPGAPLRFSLPENTRAFDDLGVYVNEATVPWVYTADATHQEAGVGTEAEPFSFPTYHHQVKGELLEYGRILYRSLQHELERDDLDLDKVFRIRERQIQFELDLSQTGRFGEIRDMLAAGFRARRVAELKEQTAALFELRDRMAEVLENRRLVMIGMVLTVVLGLLGLPGAIDFLNVNVAPHVPCLARLQPTALTRIGILGAITSAILIGVPLVLWPLLKKPLRRIARPTRIRRH